MLTKTIIEKYINRCAEIRRLSSSIYSTSFDSFALTMQENFRKIGQLAKENKPINDEIMSILVDDYTLNDNDRKILTYLSENLIDPYTMENLDLMLVNKVCQKLLSDAISSGDIEKIIVESDRSVTAAYALSNMSKRINPVNNLSHKYSEIGLVSGNKLLSLIDKDKFEPLSNDLKELILIDSRYVMALYENGNSKELYQMQYEILERSEALYHNPYYKEAVPSYDWGYHMMRVYQYYSLLEEPHKLKYITEDMKQGIAEKAKLLYQMFEDDHKYYQYIDNTEIDIILFRSQYHIGEISKEEYKEKMYEIYKLRQNSYEHADIFPNLLAPYEYVSVIDKDNITEHDKQMLETFYSGILSYIYNFKTAGSLSYMLEYLYFILESFIEIPGGVSFKTMCLECLASLHMPTYVHSNMVGRIASCICGHMLKKNRSKFDDVFKDKSDDYIKQFAYNAGLTHDFGKLAVIDTIFIYGRKLDDDEFEMVKAHAEMSDYLLSMHESTKEYATIAYNHHMFYDASRGYPLKKKEDKYKIITDIITIADCMDAATDIIGRSYNKGKSLEEFKEELLKESGTRYNPEIVALFDDELLLADLKYLLTERRNETYKSSYITLRALQEKGKVF